MHSLILALMVVGPPAPPDPAEAMAENLRLTQDHVRTMQSAQESWKWYAGAWAFDGGSSLLALRRPGTEEGNPIFGGSLTATMAAKAAMGVVCWRFEVWSAGRGEHTKFLRWLYVGLSATAGVWNLSIAF